MVDVHKTFLRKSGAKPVHYVVDQERIDCVLQDVDRLHQELGDREKAWAVALENDRVRNRG